MKLQLRWPFNIGSIKENRKQRFVTLKEAYHGDTIGAVSVGAIDLFHQVYSSLLFEAIKMPYPYTYRSPYGNDKAEIVKNI